MRVFLALEIPDGIKEYLSATAHSMAKHISGVKWVKPEGQHITLKFFGEIDSGKAKEIERTLTGIDKEHGPVTMRLKGVDAFPNLRHARVVVVTFDEGVDNVKTIFHDIEYRLADIGVEEEKREFTPHITLGRVKTPALLLNKDIPSLENKGFTVDKIVLYESTLTSSGAFYTPLKVIELRKNDSQEREET